MTISKKEYWLNCSEELKSSLERWGEADSDLILTYVWWEIPQQPNLKCSSRSIRLLPEEYIRVEEDQVLLV